MLDRYWPSWIYSRGSIRFGAALLLAIPLAVVPSQNDMKALAVAPDLVAFSQAGETSAPSQWNDRILVEDFNSSAITTTTLANGYTSSVGVFDSTGNAVIAGASQWGGAPCSDCNGTTRIDQFPAVGTGDIILTLSDETNFRYVGFAWAAGNNGNTVCLMGPVGNDSCLADYSTTDLLAHSSFATSATSNKWQDKPHYGNPRGRVYGVSPSCNAVNIGNSQGTNHCGEPFAFIHLFYDQGFSRVKFTATEGGFEFDNVTASTADSWELIDLLPAGTLIGASTLPAYSLTTARVLPVDPRDESVNFPGIILGGAAANQPNASLCLTETNASGTAVAASDSNLRISATVPAGVTAQSTSPRFAYSGSQTTIRTLASAIQINSSTNSRSVVTNNDSRYIRVSVQARTGTGLTTCSGSSNVITAVVVELRPMRLNSVNRVGIPLD